MEPDRLMGADESEYKGIRVINYILAPGIWEDNIKQDICQMKIKNWKDVVEKAKTFHH